MKAHVTLWPGGLLDIHGESIETTWPEWFARLSTAPPYLGDRKHPGWSAALLEPCERADDNVQGISALVIDYDAGTSVDDAAQMWRDHFGFVHTTRKHAPSAPRFRVILPLSRIVTVDEHAVVWRWAHDLATAAGHKIDGSTKNASRFWFLPGVKPGSPFETRTLSGADPLDPDPILASDADAGVATYVDRYAENAKSAGATLPTDPLRRAAAYLAKIPPAISGSGGHGQCWSAAMAVVVGFDLDPESAYRLLATEYNPRCQPPWNERELRHKIASAAVQCRRERGYLLRAATRTNNVRPLRPGISRPSAAPTIALRGTGTDGPAPASQSAIAQFERGDEAELAQAAYEALHRFEAPLIFDDGEFYQYAPVRGVWEVVDAAVVRNTVASFAGRWVNDGGKYRVLKISQSVCNGAANRLRDMLGGRPNRPCFSNAVAGVAFANGFVRVIDGSPTLCEHAPEHMARAGLPFDYVPDAPHPELDAFLSSTFADASEEDRADRIALLQEFIGAAMFGLAPTYQRCLMLYGTGGNGKSQVTTIAKACFPPAAVAALPPKDWDGPLSRFRLEQLQGRLINIVDEMPSRDEFMSEMFKQIVTGGEVTAERKGKDAHTFRSICGHLFAGNELPVTNDCSDGFFRRFNVLCFTRQFDRAGAETERLNDAGLEVVRKERPAIAAWAVAGAARLLRAGGYTLPQSSEALKRQWEVESNSVLMWIAEACTTNAGEAFSSTLYRSYTVWAKENGYRAVSLTSFGKRLKAAGYQGRQDRDKRVAYRIEPRGMSTRA